MVLVKPQLVVAVMSNSVVPRSELSIYGMQLVGRGNVIWAKKAAWFRNVPYTAAFPTKMQVAVRLALAEFMKRYGKGKTGIVETDVGPLVAPAAELHEKRSEFDSLIREFAAKLGASPKTGKYRRTLHTAEELARAHGVSL